MATNIPTIDVPNFVGSNFDIGDTVEVITKQNDVNQKLLDFGDDLNVTVGAINTVGDEIEQTAQDAADSATLADNLADLVAETTATYTSVSAGLADTVDTDYFRVITAPTASEVAVYRNDGGSATLITTYYTQAGVDQRNAQATRLARSLQRRGDSGQALHSDFAYGAYGLGSRVSGGVDTALSGEELWDGFQRATPAWEWQPSGPNGELRITEVPADAIGRGWDPETGEPLGVAARPSSGNYALHSNDMSVSPWATGVGVSLTEVSGGRIVKDEPEWLVEGASSVGFSQENLRHALSGLTPDILYAYSIYVIPGPGCDSISLRSNSDSQGIGSNSYTTPVTPGQLVRVDAPFASSNDSGLVTISSAFASSPGAGFTVAGFQINPGEVPTGYIPTTSSPVTRDTDDISDALGGEFNSVEGALFLKATVPNPAQGETYAAALSDGSAFARIGLEFNPASSTPIRFRVISNGEDSGGALGLSTAESEGVTEVSAIVRWQDGEFTAAINGQLLGPFQTTMPDVTHRYVGRAVSSLGPVKSVNVADVIVYPHALTDSKMQELTS